MKNYPDDLAPLVELLKLNKIPYVLRKHPIVEKEPDVKKLIGYYPTGGSQIIIDNKYSVIKGMVSFGHYEIINIEGGDRYKDPVRFTSPSDLILDYMTYEEGKKNV